MANAPNSVQLLAAQILREVKRGICASASVGQNGKSKDAVVNAIVEIIKGTVPGATQDDKKKLADCISRKILAEVIIKLVTTASTPAAPQNLKQTLNTNIKKNTLANAIVEIIKGGASKNVKKSVISVLPPESLADAILIIVSSTINAKSVLTKELSEELNKSLSSAPSNKTDVAKLILNIIKNATSPSGLTKNTANEVLKRAGPPPESPGFIRRLILGVMGKNATAEQKKKIEENMGKVPKPEGNTSNVIYKLIMNMFKNKFPVPPKMSNGGAPPPGPGGPPPPPASPRNYSKMNLENLINSLKKYPDNASTIRAYIRKLLNRELSNMRWSRGVGLYRRAAELLRLLPPNLSNRSRIIDLLLNEIERISSLSNLEAARRYLRSVRNRNINAELNRKARDLREKRREEGGRYGGGYNNRGRGRPSPPRRYNGEKTCSSCG